MSGLAALRITGARVILAALLACLPVVALAAALIEPGRIAPSLLFLALVTGAAWLTGAGRSDSGAARIALGAALTAPPMALVYVASGTGHQIDMHMTFFVALALTVLVCDWRAILAAAGVTALHHLAANFLMPALVFPDGADFGRVVLHAVVVIAETVALMWIAAKLVALFAENAAALDTAQQASAAAEHAAARERDRHEQERRQDLARRKRIKEAETKFAEASHIIGAAAQRVSGSFTQITARAEDASASINVIQDATDTSSTTTAGVAAATEELSSSIAEIAASVERSSAKSRSAQDQTTAVNAQVGALSQNAAEIGNVLSLINDIAEQTNLLALNATIEAARAGEAGKGFAVVATEVKSLATQTAKATEDISRQITAIQQVSRQTAEAVGAIAHGISEVSSSVDDVSRRAAEQNQVVGEIANRASSASDVNARLHTEVRRVSETVATTAGVAGEASAVIDELMSAAQLVERASAAFRDALEAA